jgi:ElaB/YqjD/DUF883 family membrane-anchored ribosome-binding protein
MPSGILERAATLDDVLHDVYRMKSVVTDAVEDGVDSALRTLRQGRHACEHALHDAKHAVKRNPFEAMGIVFAAGILTGTLVTLGFRRRRW